MEARASSKLSRELGAAAAALRWTAAALAAPAGALAWAGWLALSLVPGVAAVCLLAAAAKLAAWGLEAEKEAARRTPGALPENSATVLGPELFVLGGRSVPAWIEFGGNRYACKGLSLPFDGAAFEHLGCAFDRVELQIGWKEGQEQAFEAKMEGRIPRGKSDGRG